MDYKILENSFHFENIKSNSWFDIKVANIKTDIKLKNLKIVNNDKDKDILRTKTYQIFPSKKQKNILKNWILLYNISYNKTIKYLKNNKLTSFISLRPIIKKSFNNEIKKLIKKFKIPSHTIDYAIKDVVTAYKSALANYKNKNIKYFYLRYKKLSSPILTITLEDSAFSKIHNTFCKNILGKFIKSKPINILKGINHTSKLSYNQYTNKYFLNVPKEIIKENLEDRNVCAIDPGSRTFLTVCGNNKIIQIGNNSTELIRKSLNKIEETDQNLKSNLLNLKDRKKLKKAIYIRREKLRNRIKDMHYKSIKYLCNNFKAILLGKLSTKSCIANKNSKLNNVAKKDLINLKHFNFRQLLLAKGEVTNTDVQIVDESFTSKKCLKCDLINTSNSSKQFNCSQCNFSADRDIHSGFNIFVKHITKLKKYFK
jgi:putative transposase